jgi:alpha-L-fucosidase 2
MKHSIFIAGFLVLFSVGNHSCTRNSGTGDRNPHDLFFGKLATVWDEAIPQGNGLLGQLVWEKNGKLRFSLDRSDLWDLRPKGNLQNPELTFNWVWNKWKQDKYEDVQMAFDVPYDKDAAPSKIPGGALEFDISGLGKVQFVHLDIKTGICTVKWNNGIQLTTFVQADQPVGWYRFEGLNEALLPEMIPPTYHPEGSVSVGPGRGQDLRRLGYPKGNLTKTNESVNYSQEGWGGFIYNINTQWKKDISSLEGCWSISAHYPDKPEVPEAEKIVSRQRTTGFKKAMISQKIWWKDYWAKSSVSLPDSILERQYYLEMYKFGSAARNNTAPISLQAVWTADNGRLPPWKGDFHHDLNTQLSYWPSYTGNQLDLEEGFINWLWNHKPVFEKYTRNYYQKEGLNVPGVTTLEGEPMGGWIQYSLGPTVGAWLGQHFYLHWKYSMNREFLAEKAYPWIKETAIFFDRLAIKGTDNKRKLPLSSSPEIHNNSKEAWFSETTNFDLALIRWTYIKATELALELGKTEEAERWENILSEWPDFAVSDSIGLLLVPGEALKASHRHFSHLMAIHPLGLIDLSKGKADQKIISNSLSHLDKIGTDWWCGYSFSWLGNMKARALDGKGAAKALRTFSTSFCLPNSFHANGDQTGTGISKFTYRPFTLEGNFAFASGIQEMLLQSHTGIIQIFPAIPADWQNVSFRNLRARGAFLVSAEKTGGEIKKIHIISEKGGKLALLNPFKKDFSVNGIDLTDAQKKASVIRVETQPGQEIILSL